MSKLHILLLVLEEVKKDEIGLGLYFVFGDIKYNIKKILIMKKVSFRIDQRLFFFLYQIKSIFISNIIVKYEFRFVYIVPDILGK